LKQHPVNLYIEVDGFFNPEDLSRSIDPLILSRLLSISRVMRITYLTDAPLQTFTDFAARFGIPLPHALVAANRVYAPDHNGGKTDYPFEGLDNLAESLAVGIRASDEPFPNSVRHSFHGSELLDHLYGVQELSEIIHDNAELRSYEVPTQLPL